MLLIPEEVYRRLMMINPGSRTVSSVPGTSESSKRRPTTGTTPIEYTVKQMADTSSNRNPQEMNDDERLIHYQQEFKRYQKLLTDEEERPLNVHLSDQTTNALRDTLQKSTTAKPQKQQQQRAPPTKRPKRVALRQPQHTRAALSSSSSSSTDTEKSGDGSQNKSNASSIFVDCKEQQQQAASSRGAAPPPAQSSGSEDVLLEQAELKREAALAYAVQNPSLLGLGGADRMQILRVSQGAYRPVKGSNLVTLLNYHFHERRQRVPPAKAPPGYATFVGHARDDLQMCRLLYPEKTAEHKSGSTSSRAHLQRLQQKQQQPQKMGGRGALLRFKKTKVVHVGNNFRFKPQLWHVERVLDPLYKDERSSACFTSVEPLLREARRTHSTDNITRAEVRRYLAGQRVYTLHRQAIRRFRRLPTLASGLHTDWQADLADFRRLQPHNQATPTCWCASTR
uniref:Uncharacterized protein n=1 Tax=Globodera pallida TaxID=36090 RepID=A0A183C303_GLOPA